MEHDASLATDVKTAVIKVFTTWACVFIGWKLTDVATLLAILYTVLNLYVLWRDKLRSKREDRQEPPDDPASPR